MFCFLLSIFPFMAPSLEYGQDQAKVRVQNLKSSGFLYVYILLTACFHNKNVLPNENGNMHC